MTQHRIELDAADHRRALVALSHYLNDNAAGLAAIFQETNETGRRIEMTLAMMHVFVQLIPEFRTDLGQQMLSQQIMHAATAEGEENNE